MVADIDISAIFVINSEVFIMNDIILEQILYIRDLGVTNMFDVDAVKQYAKELGFTELEKYIEKDKRRYFNFILNGNEG